MAAAALAAKGRSVVLIDEKLAWEKPCGGGVTAKALRLYPFLNDAEVPRNNVGCCQLISPSGVRFEFELQPAIAIFSRKVLNSLMLERARAAGAEIVCDRVVRIDGPAGAWRLTTRDSGVIDASFLVLAAGARSQFRAQFSRAFSSADLMVTAGYFIPGSSARMQIRFLPGIEGYIWTFPRCDHFSAGICGKINSPNTAGLRQLLENFLAEEGFDFSAAELYGHVLPAPSREMLETTPISGDGWAMVGDAAGLIDPITGEGLYYAFRSGDLLATALLQGRPEGYEPAVRADFLHELITAASLARRFFVGDFMGAPACERLVRFAASSAAFCELLRDLFAGTQSYAGLRDRGYRMLPRILFGMGWSHLLGETPDL